MVYKRITLHHSYSSAPQLRQEAIKIPLLVNGNGLCWGVNYDVMLSTILYWLYGRPWITMVHYQESVILSVTWLE